MDKLEAMISGQNKKISKDEIRGTDISTEYLFIFAIAFIATIGGLVAWQIKKGSATLPIATHKRID